MSGMSALCLTFITWQSKLLNSSLSTQPLPSPSNCSNMRLMRSMSSKQKPSARARPRFSRSRSLPTTTSSAKAFFTDQMRNSSKPTTPRFLLSSCFHCSWNKCAGNVSSSDRLHTFRTTVSNSSGESRPFPLSSSRVKMSYCCLTASTGKRNFFAILTHTSNSLTLLCLPWLRWGNCCVSHTSVASESICSTSGDDALLRWISGAAWTDLCAPLPSCTNNAESVHTRVSAIL
mmetsp:Transcript_96485/g.241998  ORF Transcript_96485/g.241998 Transcript_96485/m.241998 type:complete len:232 (+) Transcript_96485:275-970(+)